MKTWNEDSYKHAHGDSLEDMLAEDEQPPTSYAQQLQAERAAAQEAEQSCTTVKYNSAGGRFHCWEVWKGGKVLATFPTIDQASDCAKRAAAQQQVPKHTPTKHKCYKTPYNA